jgi:dipeptidyl aminopeptidase/acylaminoacyl peptidase
MRAFDIDTFLGLPRLSGLRLSPAGDRLIVSVALPDAEGKRFASSLWQLDPTGRGPARRVTRSAPGESAGTFLRDGSILFTSSRPDPDLPPDRRDTYKDVSGLWLLPAGGGEARPVASPHGGVESVRAAAAADVILFATGVHPGSADAAADEARETARTKAGVAAHLFEAFPIRYWDHYLGPRERRLMTARLTDDPATPAAELRDLAPDAGDALRETDADLAPDGDTVVTGWRREDPLTRPCVDLVAIDRATGTRRTLAREDAWHTGIRISPDGRSVACVRVWNGDLDHADRPVLLVVDLATGEAREIGGDLGGAWPHDLAWAPDSASLLVTADRRGHVAVLRVSVGDGSVTLVAAEGAHGDPAPAPDGSTVYALRSTMTAPPRPVRLDGDGDTPLPFPGLEDEAIGAPGVAERLTATASDGTTIESWLVRPADASAERPAPLVVFIHGGPIGSWNTWHWRWNPSLLVERGYAVLLPDPAISTGYGQAFVDRGWGRWGEEPYTDLMAAVDAALERPDLDAERTAAMGGSFGGYMANWVAGHTDRFKGIITHASLWELRGFHGTTDHGPSWEAEFGDPYVDPSRYEAASPHRFVDRIRTPMLVIHGELDHRVPISEALRLWTDLRRHGVPSRFLYFPDENHWVLKPQNARLWYGTVLAFLDETVLGRDWVRPDLV